MAIPDDPADEHVTEDAVEAPDDTESDELSRRFAAYLNS
jgi:hypothetical protein